jgi:hypothetical protein
MQTSVGHEPRSAPLIHARTHPRAPRFLPLLALAAAATIADVEPLAAQSSATIMTGCSDTKSTGSSSSASISDACTRDGVSVAGSAYAIDGRVGASTRASGSTTVDWGRHYAFASTQWSDRLSWTSPDVAEIVFVAAVTGSTHVNASASIYSAALAEARFVLGISTSWSGTHQEGWSVQPTVSTHSPETKSESHAVFVTNRVLLTAFDRQVRQANFWMTLVSQSYMDAGFVASGSSFSGSASSDFGHTAKLSGLVFRDAAGKDITSEVEFSFANGTQLYPAATVAPEPVSMGLLATGLLGVGVARRRRRQRAEEV